MQKILILQTDKYKEFTSIAPKEGGQVNIGKSRPAKTPKP